MQSNFCCVKYAVLFGLACGLPGGFVPHSVLAQQPPPPRPDYRNETGVVELNRGPLHQAFAQPYRPESSSGLTIDREPPPPIRELIPRIGPRHQEYQWIPGYWGWEPARNEFVWISGIWRRPPEEMVWNPGYWEQVGDQYAWVSGFWSRGRESELLLVPQSPPASRSEDPGRQPSPDHFWVPGRWELVRGQFLWKSGFWSEGQEGLVWMPFRYSWTPHGHVAIPGYWDYRLESRGVLFNPIAIDDGFDRDFQYSPKVVVKVDRLPIHLFVDLDYGHYCFGDYYQTTRSRSGFYSWTDPTTNFYDPLRSYYRRFADNQWQEYHSGHDYYRDHVDLRPRHTWREEQRWENRNDESRGDALLSAGLDFLVDGQHFDGQGQGVRFGDQSDSFESLSRENARFGEQQQRRQEWIRESVKRRNEDLNEYEKREEEYYRELEKKEREQFGKAVKKREEFAREAAKKQDELAREAAKKQQEQLKKLEEQQRKRFKKN